jgi:hypothetical protein
MKAKSLSLAFFYFHLFFRIRTFQWVSGDSNQFFSPRSPVLVSYILIKPPVIPAKPPRIEIQRPLARFRIGGSRNRKVRISTILNDAGGFRNGQDFVDWFQGTGGIPVKP